MTTLKIYQSHLTLGRNAKVDNIEGYLATLTPKAFNIQYQKLAADIVINLNLPQADVGDAKYNYARLEQDGKIYYFFIIGAEWKAKKTVALSLSMDTVNTFWDELVWSSKTNIIREHQDRFVSSSLGRPLVRKIDKFNEGLDSALTHQAMDKEFESENIIGRNMSWYMIYKTRDAITPDNTINPVSAMIVAEQPIEYKAAVSNADKTYPLSVLTQGDTIYITNTGGVDGASIEFTGNVKQKYIFGTDSDGSVVRAFRIKKISLHNYRTIALYYTGDSYPYSFKKEKDLGGGYNPENVNIILHNIAKASRTDANVEYYQNLNDLSAIDNAGTRIEINAGNLKAQTIIAFKDVDRSNSRFIKIIQLPYAPCSITYDYANRQYIFPQGWGYNPGYQAMEVNLKDQEFTSNLIAQDLNSWMTYQVNTPTGGEMFIPYRESKIYSSQFFQMSLVYGDAVLPIKLERLIYQTDTVIKPKFYLSNALSSTMLFKTEYPGMYYEKEYPQDGLLFSTVNTEKPIFNSGFVDYLRNGYNYDKEALNQQNRMAAVQGALSAVSGLVGLGGAATSYGINRYHDAQRLDRLHAQQAEIEQSMDRAGIMRNVSAAGITSLRGIKGIDAGHDNAQDMLIRTYHDISNDIKHFTNTKMGSVGISLATQLISGGINAFASAFSTVNGIESNNRNFAAGMTAKQAQSVGALGISDINIQTIALGNKLKLIAYEPEEEVQKQLAKMFHLIGYSHPLQEIPDFTSRHWFNFVQCNPVFKDEEVSIYSNYLDDIKARFAAGITVYHQHGGIIDWEQERENWEQWMFPQEAK